MIIIAPDKYTLQAERAVLSAADDGVSFDTEVYSFDRLYHRLTNGSCRRVLPAARGVMSVQRILCERGAKMKCFRRSAGFYNFASRLYGSIRALKAARIGPGDISGARLTDAALKHKLGDIIPVYEEYERRKGDAYDINDRMAALADVLRAGALRGEEITVAGFDFLSGVERRILECAEAGGARVTVAGSDWGSDGRADAPLRTAYAAREPSDETAKAASLISDYLRGGVKASDILVVCGDVARYAPRIERIFSDRGIRYFIDKPENLTAHPLYLHIVSGVRAARTGSREDVLNFVKSPYSEIGESEGDAFENFVLRCGIDRGGFSGVFASGRAPVGAGAERREGEIAAVAAAEKTRVVAAAGISRFKDPLAGAAAAVADERAASVTERLAAAALAAGDKERAEILRAGAEGVAAAVADIRTAFENCPLLPENFLKAFEAVATTRAVNVLPQYAEDVYVGGIDSPRFCNPEILLVLGANEGTFPAVIAESGILNDRDIGTLSASGLGAPPSRREEDERAWRRCERVLSLPRRALHVSWTAADAAGKAARQSSLLRLFMRGRNFIGPFNRAYDFEVEGVRARPRTNDALSSAAVSAGGDGGYAPPSERFDGARSAFFSDGRARASEIECYYECPRKHFLQYGAKLLPRPEARAGASETGSLMHLVLEKFVRGGMKNAAENFDAVTSDGQFAFMRATAEGRNALRRLKDEAVRVCGVLVEQLALSKFTPGLTEAEFPGENLTAPKFRAGGAEMTLRGRIDRVDFAEIDGRKFARVIDYKTGHIEGGEAAGRLGTNLQLPVYLAALSASGYVPAGAFYFPVHNNPKRDYKMKGYVLTEHGVPFLMDCSLENGGASEVINIKLNKDNSFRKSPYALSAAAMDEFIGGGMELLSRACEKIADGDRAVYPVRRACDRCAYGGVCDFDPDGGEYRTE